MFTMPALHYMLTWHSKMQGNLAEREPCSSSVLPLWRIVSVQGMQY